jgi:uncharacterized membrane protein YbhN (UPF0104 family)
VSIVSYYAAYALLVIVMMVALWVHHAATAIVVGPITAFLLVALAIPSLWLWLWRRGERRLPKWLERIRPLARLVGIIGEAPGPLLHNRRLLAQVAFWNGVVFICDALTLAACVRALGGPLIPATSFIAFMSASIAVTLAPLPMGLGSFEATSTAMLAFLGLPAALALAATLLLRILTLWLPLLPGLWITARARRLRNARG